MRRCYLSLLSYLECREQFQGITSVWLPCRYLHDHLRDCSLFGTSIKTSRRKYIYLHSMFICMWILVHNMLPCTESMLFFESSYSKHLLFLLLLPSLQLVTYVWVTISNKTLMYEYTCLHGLGITYIVLCRIDWKKSSSCIYALGQGQSAPPFLCLKLSECRGWWYSR